MRCANVNTTEHQVSLTYHKQFPETNQITNFNKQTMLKFQGQQTMTYGGLPTAKRTTSGSPKKKHVTEVTNCLRSKKH